MTDAPPPLEPDLVHTFFAAAMLGEVDVVRAMLGAPGHARGARTARDSAACPCRSGRRAGGRGRGAA